MCHQNQTRLLCLLRLCLMVLALPFTGYCYVQAVTMCLSLCPLCAASGSGAIGVKSSLMRVKHEAKFRWGGGRSETTAFPPFQLQMEVRHKCQSDTAEALWALSQLLVAQSCCCCPCGCRAIHSPWPGCQPGLWGGGQCSCLELLQRELALPISDWGCISILPMSVTQRHL